ncbi:MAG: hypothetical protein WDZ83_15080 [Rhizobiaceae bacterium]
MKRPVAIVHGIAGVTAFAIISTFMLASVVTEISGDHQAVAAAKSAIRWGLLALVPALAAAGGSGYRLVGGSAKGLAGVKLARMRIVAANGAAILVPCVLFLAWKADRGEFDMWFAAVQAVEYLAGATNLALMGLNMRDGFRLSGRFRRRPVLPASR